MPKDTATEVLSNPSAVPQQLAITQDARMRQVQAEVISRYQLALMIPRNWLDVSSKLKAACSVSHFAALAIYSKPLGGGSNAEGLSIRFAELALQHMRNVSIDTSVEMEDAFSAHYRMIITDLEANVTASETFKVEKTVERRHVREGDLVLSERLNSGGEKVHLLAATEDQFLTKVRSQQARVRRNLILSLLPAELRTECFQLCQATLEKGAHSDPQATIKELVACFLAIGIDVADLKAYLGKSPQSMAAVDIQELRGIYPLLRDGEITWDDALAARRERTQAKTPRAEFVQEKQKARAQRRTAAAPPPAGDAPKGGKGRRAAAAAAAKEPEAAAASGGATRDSAPATAAAPAAPRASRRGGEDDDDEPLSSSPGDE